MIVVSDSADVTSSGRSFLVCGPAIGKAQSAGRHCQAIGADRTQ